MMLFKDDSKKSLWNLSIIGLYIILIYLPDITRYKNIVMGLIGATALWYLVRDFRTIGQIFKNNLAYALFFYYCHWLFSRDFRRARTESKRDE